ncbi:unnamed protein product, partial [Polarella glacialis]
YFYKVVARVGGQLLSIFDGQTVYAVGRLLRQEVRPGHRGGLYVARTARDAVRATFHLPQRSRLLLAPRVLLRCEAKGPFLDYGQGKVAVSALLPVEAKALDSNVPATYAGRCRAARRPQQPRPGSAPTGGRLPASSEAWGSHDFLLSGSLAARRPASDAFEPVEPMPASSSELLVTAVVERAAAAALSRGGGLGLESEPWAWTLGS